MPVCAFCGHEFPKHMGILYVSNSGRTYWFCSKRCFKSMIEFKRRPEKFKWTRIYRIRRQKEKAKSAKTV